MPDPTTPSEQITKEVTHWPGITARRARRGELAFVLDGREIGHLHGDRSAHFSFPPEVWDELKRQKRVTEHPVFPGRVGPAARPISSEHDVREVIALMRLNYDRISPKAPSAKAERQISDDPNGSESRDRRAHDESDGGGRARGSQDAASTRAHAQPGAGATRSSLPWVDQRGSEVSVELHGACR